MSGFMSQYDLLMYFITYIILDVMLHAVIVFLIVNMCVGMTQRWTPVPRVLCSMLAPDSLCVMQSWRTASWESSHVELGNWTLCHVLIVCYVNLGNIQ